ncbi:DNA glycosylase family protein [Mycobacteroides abscessus]|uniref:hypothetical protein n=1 Tax=Mycobacteroides abscessus TaxID=36809 RepID=UPI0009C9251B|nr:hypothetical protein [Mycobacteroides abscessus]SKI12414.1 3-methyladenine DNA glycosylase/8-oxoguanine DNA glycosylase [Mycobacteroides abscessus subsp. massiliense]SKM21229.1 3-methyladenine DNA glycosylase/8-oxoguanine DNA glycosylase [Mycobacteroides abscessus subsp. massiliense]
MIVDNVMTDHPSWQIANDAAVRCVRSDNSIWMITCESTPGGRQRVGYQQLCGDGPPPQWTKFDCRRLGGESALGREMRAMKTVVRWRNADLWDALATSIIRQVIRAAHARRLYWAACQEFGTVFPTGHGEIALFPDPQTILGLADGELNRTGLSFKKAALRAAAQAYLDSAERWKALPPKELVDALTAVHRVGEWTARATVADYSNDFSLYPYGDLAVRTWVAAMDGDTPWPTTDAAFAATWENLAATELSTWTVSTLAFGARHGRIAASRAGTRAG